MPVIPIKANGEQVFMEVQSSDGRRKLYRVDASDKKCSAQLSNPSEAEVKSLQVKSPKR